MRKDILHRMQSAHMSIEEYEILKAAGYVDPIASHIAGTTIYDDLNDYTRDWPDYEPDIVTVNGVTYYIAQAL